MKPPLSIPPRTLAEEGDRPVCSEGASQKANSEPSLEPGVIIFICVFGSYRGAVLPDTQ